MTVDLYHRHFLTLEDLDQEEILYLLRLSAALKAARRDRTEQRRLEGKNIALIFEKTSTRTLAAFQVAAFDQGANVTYFGPSESHLGDKESMKDTARVLGRMYDGIEYRGFGQEIVETLAEYAGVPVWNGLTDEYHPTQILADFLTMSEHTDKDLAEISFCYLGDARNNMGNSLTIGASKLGMDLRLAAPEQCWPRGDLLKRARDNAESSGGRLLLTDNVEQAVEGVDFLYTDVWLSLGEPASKWAERIDLLRPYQVNHDVVQLTGNPNVKFMHCLPAFHDRGTTIGQEIFEKFGLDCMEVTDDVFESRHSIVFAQAENRLHTVKAILVATLAS